MAGMGTRLALVMSSPRHAAGETAEGGGKRRQDDKEEKEDEQASPNPRDR